MWVRFGTFDFFPLCKQMGVVAPATKFTHFQCVYFVPDTVRLHDPFFSVGYLFIRLSRYSPANSQHFSNATKLHTLMICWNQLSCWPLFVGVLLLCSYIIIVAIICQALFCISHKIFWPCVSCFLLCSYIIIVLITCQALFLSFTQVFLLLLCAALLLCLYNIIPAWMCQ